MNWLYYLAEANLYLGVFYLAYCLFLNKETHYLLNRIYLLFSCAAAFILPVIQLGVLKPAEKIVQPLTIMMPVTAVHYTRPIAMVTRSTPWFTLQNGLLGAYLLGVLALMIFLVIKLYRLYKLTHTQAVLVDDKYKLIHINESNTAFSFFNCLFIGTKASDTETIIRHELVHIRQKHSVDIVILELIKIINWFNPLVYLLQNSLKTVHEYIADEQTAAYNNDRLTYSTFLVNNAYGIGGPTLTHSFFNYNLLKKRIIMLNQKRSGSLARLKYLVTVPLCAGLLCSSTLAFSKTYGLIELFPQQADTLNKTPPPPPPRPPAANARLKANVSAPHVFFAAPKPPAQITGKGYHYAESGYLINGKTNYRVIIVAKNGSQKSYYKNSATPAELKLLKDKYGYQFPTMEIYAKLPPPPPMPPAGAPGTQPVPPVPAKAVKPGKLAKLQSPVVVPDGPVAPTPLTDAKPAKPAKMKKLPPPVIKPDGPVAPTPLKDAKPAKPAVPADAKALPPPPPPMRPYLPLRGSFSALDKYIAKYVRYPAVARNNKVMGSVIAQFDLNADHKITNVSMIKGIGSSCDEEATRVLNNFSDQIEAKPGTYKMAITFAIDGMNMPIPASETLNGDPLYIGEVVVVAYL